MGLHDLRKLERLGALTAPKIARAPSNLHKRIRIFNLIFVQHYVFTNQKSSVILCLQGKGNNLIKVPEKKLKKFLTKPSNLVIIDLSIRNGKETSENAERLGDVEQNYGFGIFTYKATSHKKISKKIKKVLDN